MRTKAPISPAERTQNDKGSESDGNDNEYHAQGNDDDVSMSFWL